MSDTVLLQGTTRPRIRIYDLQQDVFFNQVISLTTAQFNASFDAQDYVQRGLLRIVLTGSATPSVSVITDVNPITFMIRPGVVSFQKLGADVQALLGASKAWFFAQDPKFSDNAGTGNITWGTGVIVFQGVNNSLAPGNFTAVADSLIVASFTAGVTTLSLQALNHILLSNEVVIGSYDFTHKELLILGGVSKEAEEISFVTAGTVFVGTNVQSVLQEVSGVFTGGKILSGYDFEFTSGSLLFDSTNINWNGLGTFQASGTQLLWEDTTFSTHFITTPTQLNWGNGVDFFIADHSQLHWGNGTDFFTASDNELFWTNGPVQFSVTPSQVTWQNGTDQFTVNHGELFWTNNTTQFLIEDSELYWFNGTDTFEVTHTEVHWSNGNETFEASGGQLQYVKNSTGITFYASEFQFYYKDATVPVNEFIISSSDSHLLTKDFTHDGAILQRTQAITNKAAGGNIGTAANTVDKDSAFNVNQTTAAQTLTLPNPTVTTAGRHAYVSNIGSTSFTMLGIVLNNGASLHALWNGTAWSLVGHG